MDDTPRTPSSFIDSDSDFDFDDLLDGDFLDTPLHAPESELDARPLRGDDGSDFVGAGHARSRDREGVAGRVRGAAQRAGSYRGRKLGRAGKSSAYRPMRLRNANWSRIATAVFVAVVALLIVVLIVRSIVSHHRQSTYRNYMASVQTIAQDSQSDGQQLHSILSAPVGNGASQTISSVEKLASHAQELVKQAENIGAPSAMHGANGWFVATLQYREHGLQAAQQALAEGFAAGKDRQGLTKAAKAFAGAAQRLIASDVICSDSFAAQATTVLDHENVTGASVPNCTFVQNQNLDNVENAKLMLQRLGTKGSTGKHKKFVPDGKVHGVSLDAVSAGGVQLSASSATTIHDSDKLGFSVTVDNGGQAQETQVPVSIDITGDGTPPIHLTGVIDSINPGKSASVTLPLDTSPTFGVQQNVKVMSGPVPGEKNAGNNGATYPIIFAL